MKFQEKQVYLQKKMNNNRLIKGDAAIPLHPEGWSSLAAVYDGTEDWRNI